MQSKTQKYYEEEINGVKVLRIRVPEFSKTNKKSRVKNIVCLISMMSFGIRNRWKCRFLTSKSISTTGMI